MATPSATRTANKDAGPGAQSWATPATMKSASSQTKSFRRPNRSEAQPTTRLPRKMPTRAPALISPIHQADTPRSSAAGASAMAMVPKT